LGKYGYKESWIMCTPGHSECSLSVVIGKEAVVGDLMYNRFFGFMRNYASYNNDLDKVFLQWDVLTKMGIMNFHPGHGTVIEANKIKDYLQNLK